MGSGVSERIVNVDFLLVELESDAEWLKDLKARNYQLGIATNKVAMDSGTTTHSLTSIQLKECVGGC